MGRTRFGAQGSALTTRKEKSSSNPATERNQRQGALIGQLECSNRHHPAGRRRAEKLREDFLLRNFKITNLLFLSFNHNRDGSDKA